MELLIHAVAYVLALALFGVVVAGLLVHLGGREVSWTPEEILEREG